MTATRRIGILTGGGDVPGLNAVIKSVVYRATEARLRRSLGIRRGWEGLTHLRPGAGARSGLPPAARPDQHPDDRPDRRHDPPHLADEPAQDARGRRCPPGSTETDARGMRRRRRPVRPDAASCSTTSRALGIDVARHDRRRRHAVASRRSSSNAGVPLVAIPKTMDNDVQGTEYCIGFSTAITRAKEAINRQRTTLGSHERIGVFRIFGRDAGFSALYTAYVTSARCVIPEAPVRPRSRWRRSSAADHARQPEPLRLRHHRRGRDLAGRADDRRRRRRRVRPPPQGERRRGAGGRAQARGPGSRRSRPS